MHADDRFCSEETRIDALLPVADDLILVCGGCGLNSATSDVRKLFLITGVSLPKSVASMAPKICDLEEL